MQLRRDRPRITEAHQLYLKGRFFWNKRTGDDLKKSIDYFNQAIATDPKYALAYVGLPTLTLCCRPMAAVVREIAIPKAKAAAKKALALDDTLAEAHASLGKVLCDL